MLVKSLEISNSFDFESNTGFNFHHFGVFMINFKCLLPNKALLRSFTNTLLLRLCRKLTLFVVHFENIGSGLCKAIAVLQLCIVIKDSFCWWWCVPYNDQLFSSTSTWSNDNTFIFIVKMCYRLLWCSHYPGDLVQSFYLVIQISRLSSHDVWR